MSVLAPILAKVAAWLTSKVGTVVGSILFFIFEKVVVRLMNAVAAWWERSRRAKDQEEKQKKVEEDIEQGKPRDPETGKKEEDWLNS